MARAANTETEYPEADRASGCAHPRHVYDLLGHGAAEQRVAAQIASGHMHHALLITGPKGVGKATLAYRIVRKVLGGTESHVGRLDVPADDPTASRVASLGHGDFLLLRPPYDFKLKKLRSEIVVSELRRLSDFFAHKPSEGGWRVCLIDSADDLNISAANALLKTLEEPPSNALLILLSSEPGRLLPTIRSRCMNLSLRAVPKPEIKNWLLKRDVTEKTADIAAALSRGAPGKAFALAQSEAKVLRPLADILSPQFLRSSAQDHRIAGALAAHGAATDRDLFWDSLVDIIGEQSRYSATGEWNSAFGPMQLPRPTEFWLDLRDRLTELRRAEDSVNMDKNVTMLTVFSALRGEAA
ncbi:DNA polymerase III subunit delta' [Robiginitomaculum antarcticum]|uniref:DNA polymerase III subunit delta' n=1 Tax=Robiginitomaculum antarcticum TaxID=437507 RepID=UPI000382C01A|nr:DNA polymerase III subunit delta' [Robiginitomaculum antarcticum]